MNWLIILGIILIIIWIVAAIYITNASVALQNATDKTLGQAYWYAVTASSVAWISIILFIIIFILALYYQVGTWLILLLLLITLTLIIITGVLSILSAHTIATSTTAAGNAYMDSIIAATLTVGASGTLILGTIVYLIISAQQKRRDQAELRAIEIALIKQKLAMPEKKNND